MNQATAEDRLVYLFHCWGMVVLCIMQSVMGEFPYRRRMDEPNLLRPEPFAEYIEFRGLQR